MKRIVLVLSAFVDEHGLGDVLAGEPGFVISGPGEPDTVLAPECRVCRRSADSSARVGAFSPAGS